MERRRIEEMTWVEIKEALAKGYTRVIIPLGSIEQHGPHLPLVTDTLFADVIADRIADKLGCTLVAPTIRPGCSEHHMNFPGTLTITSDLLAALTRAYCHSYAHHGFQKILVLPIHGGNFPTVARVVPEIAREIPAQVVGYSDLVEFAQAMDSIAATFGITSPEAGIHAGCSETSVVLAARPDLVRLDQAQPGFVGDSAEVLNRLKPGSSGFAMHLEEFSLLGVLGDPRRATVELGNALLEGLAERIAAYFRAAIA
jgi:creatinine amidohydrolase